MEIDSQTHEQNEQHTVTIWEINPDRLAAMKHELSESDPPKVLSEGAGQESCSIYKVPQNLIYINGSSYEPRIVSIGPFHHGKPHLQMFRKHKCRFLNHMLNRTKSEGKVLEDYLNAVQPLERKARMCYSQTIDYTSDEFIEMMVLDACFIIELFWKRYWHENDPILSVNRINSFFIPDLIRLENQIPYFILECLFELTKPPKSPTLTTLALTFFNQILHQRPTKFLEKSSNIEANHLLDLLRQRFITQKLRKSTRFSLGRRNILGHLVEMRFSIRDIPNISKLSRAGIQLKPCYEAETFLLVKFKNGVIHMPTITINDFMCTFLLNSVAFEQCHSGCSKHFSSYVTLLDCLINTSKDVELLCDWNIIENYLGTDGEVATSINNIGKDVSLDVFDFYLFELFYRVSKHYHNRWHVHRASFMNTYFNTPWSFLSALAALVLLILTVTQTFYAVLSYARPP